MGRLGRQGARSVSVLKVTCALMGTFGSVSACAGTDPGKGSDTTGAGTGGVGSTTAAGASGTSSTTSGGSPSGGSGPVGSGGSQSAFVWTRPPVARPRALWGSSERDVYGVASSSAWHGSMSSWQESRLEGTSSAAGVWGSGATEVFLVQSDGSFYQSSGDNVWTLSPQQPNKRQDAFLGLRGFGGGIYAFGGFYSKADVQRREADGTWSTVFEGTATQGPVWDVWGASADDFYVCISNGGNGVYRRRGTPPFVLEHAGNCASLSGTGPTDVYVAGIAGLFHSQGDGQWEAIAVPLAKSEVPFVVFAQAPNAVFMGTNDSTVFFFDGTEWTNIGRQNGGSHKAIWAPSPDEVYVAGLDGFWHGKRRVP
jgi:hypothetical protein